MTTGSKNESYMSSVSTGCGTASVGSKSTRTWSGSDDPSKTKENPYTTTRTKSVEPLIQWKNKSSSTWNTGTVSTCGFRTPAPDPTQAEKDLLRTRVLKGVLGKYKKHDFNASVFLGELPETVKMVSEPVLDVLRAYRHVRKGRFDKAVKIFKTRDPAFRVDRHASNAWLSLQYGWLPAISDAYAAAEAYDAIVREKPFTYIRARSKATKNFPAAKSTYNVGAVTMYGIAVILKTTYKQSIWESLGILNPAVLAWELLPFSFVLDWAYDIGSWLELVTTLPSGQGSTYITTERIWKTEMGPVSTTAKDVKGSEGFRYSSVYLKRTISSAPGVPPPRLKNPFNGTAKRVFDAVALARAVT